MVPTTLSTPRLLLRPFRPADAPAFPAYINHPDMGTYLEGDGRHVSEEKAREIIERHLQADPLERAVWAITADDQLVGALTINLAKQGRVAEIGYSISRSHWGRGYATEAVRTLVDTAFGDLPELQRIQANIHPQNLGSIRVVTAAGMRFEGTLRAYAFVAGEVADENIYAITRTDYEAP